MRPQPCLSALLLPLLPAYGGTIRSLSATSESTESTRSTGSADQARHVATSIERASSNENVNVPVNNIIGGTTSKQGEFPFFVKGIRCGASLIWEDVILTSASCYGDLNDYSTSPGGVWVGAYKTHSTQGGAEVREVVDQIRHPDYNLTNNYNDYMVAKLDRPVTSKKPVTLNKQKKLPADGAKVVATGFGQTESGFDSDVLKKVELKAVAFATCKRQYDRYHVNIEDDIMICANTRSRSGPCHHDGGAPLLYNGKQVGIASFDQDCARNKKPPVFSRVSAVYKWIQEQTCYLSGNPPPYCTGSFYPKQTVRIDFQYDYTPKENSWKLIDSASNEVLLDFPVDPKALPYYRQVSYINLQPSSQYTISVTDSIGSGAGDGINGFVNVTYIKSATEKVDILNAAFDFETETSISFETPVFN